MSAANPLLLTLTLNPEAQQYFDALRQRHFPPERNFLGAHLMLFHQLPPDEGQIITDIMALAGSFKQMTLQVTALNSIGNGVAFKVESGQLQAMHRGLQTQWQQWLIPQDKNKIWPHVTVQNKVTPGAAKALLLQLSQGFEPFEMYGTGLTLWEYKGGPWAFKQHFGFTG